ncbi:amino acid permease [Halosimplex aquaticum]|uniref:Amino acid permease n=1 Tax=Halosimplex aquaticum TaxID=3026162 RepID=A0ABD5XZX0_9EURY|nr:amino acid permease [Halosimplex aquaticum]
MPKELERDLGLPSVLAISIGAMVGSGIFILPALALKMAGPAVILAYLLAGLLVLPAALSKAEMATAMPEAGGTYIYIERGMGPMLGTVAGIGTWFALSFKGALALVGGVPYLVVLFDLPIKPVALGLAALLIVVNLFGAKQTGRLQVAIVAAMLAAMVWFVGGSVGSVERQAFGGFFEAGGGGLLAATGFVFVSYAGVTKIASVAEEVEDPGRVIPKGMIYSLGFTTLLYVLIVAVIVGVTPEGIVGSNTPVADVAEATMPTTGVVAVVAAAILALVSTANAGLLSSSRYPFAMSRDQLAPPSLSTISDRFNTPTAAISLTGLVMLALIAFVPIMEIAKLASAFQILVFVLVNVAVVAFRKSDAEYEPSYEAPLYPWMQGFGVVGGLVLLTQMGWLPLAGAVVITAAGALWYYGYARRNVDREGAAADVVRRRIDRRAVEATSSTFRDGGDGDVLVAVTEDTTEERERTLLSVGASLARRDDGSVTVVQFDQVPDQTPLDYAEGVVSDADQRFEERTDRLVTDLDVPVEYGEVVSHDAARATNNFATAHDFDLVVAEPTTDDAVSRLLGDLFDDGADYDLVTVAAEDVDDLDTVTLVTDRGPFDPVKVTIADALAGERGGTLRLVHGIAADAPPERRESVVDYHDALADLCSAPVESRVVEGRDTPTALAEATHDSELVVAADDGDVVLQSAIGDRLSEGDTGLITVQPQGSRRPGPLGRLIERAVF